MRTRIRDHTHKHTRTHRHSLRECALGTVAILAQGTSWADAATQPFCVGSNPHGDVCGNHIGEVRGVALRSAWAEEAAHDMRLVALVCSCFLFLASAHHRRRHIHAHTPAASALGHSARVSWLPGWIAATPKTAQSSTIQRRKKKRRKASNTHTHTH